MHVEQAHIHSSVINSTPHGNQTDITSGKSASVVTFVTSIQKPCPIKSECHYSLRHITRARPHQIKESACAHVPRAHIHYTHYTHMHRRTSACVRRPAHGACVRFCASTHTPTHLAYLAVRPALSGRRRARTWCPWLPRTAAECADLSPPTGPDSGGRSSCSCRGPDPLPAAEWCSGFSATRWERR